MTLPDRAQWFNDRHGWRVEHTVRADDDAAVWARFNTAHEELTLDFNPSRLTVPGGGLCRFDDLPRALEMALELVHQELGVAVEPKERLRAVVLRADLSRDWAMREARSALPALLPLRRNHATKLHQWSDPTTLLVTGVQVGNSTSHAKLYVRQGEHPEFPGDDWMRFEVQCRENWLLKALPAHQRKDRRQITFGELTPENCTRLLEERWLWSKFGTPYASTAAEYWSAARRLMDDRLLRGYAGFLFGLEHGLDLGYGKDQLKKHQDMLAHLGAPPRPDAGELGSAGWLWLSLTSDQPRRRPARRQRAGL